jgi:hypothetical protein
VNYLASRENYKIAFHKWQTAQNNLCLALNCEHDELERSMLEARVEKIYDSLIEEYNKISIVFDRASTIWEKSQQMALNHDIKHLDC